MVGLGNPGPKYAQTRHNAGFLVVDELAARAGAAGWQQKFKGEHVRARVGGSPASLLKPLTYMNLSGRSVSRALGFYQIPADEMIVVHDDVDLDFGVVRVKSGGGTGGHKGLKSLKQDLGDTGFVRVRVGIGRPVHGSVTDFVLQKFASDEAAVLTDVIARAADAVETVVREGVTRAMNQFNKRGGDQNEP